MTDRGTDPLVGAVVDQRYLVHSRLARGGMSTVYLATDQRLEREVALKVMYPHLAADPSFLTGFSREAKSAARLSHPHVVSVMDQGRDNGLVYLVMEYISGHTLRDVLTEQHQLRPRLTLALLDAVAEGLGAAHKAGLVHRDVKPENVLMAEDGRIKIGDFGLARAVSTSTSTGTLIGTVAYMAPELVSGGLADARSDIYSVGIMLYEMLTGRHPYTGDVPIQVAYQHVNSEVPAPSAVLPGLAADLDELVQWCTAADPEERPIDANALLGELRHIRRSLTDAELDYAPPRDEQDDDDGAPEGDERSAGQDEGRTTIIPVPVHSADTDANATTVLPQGSAGRGEALPHRPTEVISRHSNPTSVLRRGAYGAASSAYPVDADIAETSGERPQSKRAAKREQKDHSKAQMRAAQRPEQNLRRGNPRRRGALWLVLLIILTLLISAAAWYLAVGPGALTAVPQVANKTVAQAEQLLQERGLDSTQDSVHDEQVPSGLIVGSEPAASTQIRKYESVQLLVSLGPELYSVPEVTGGTLQEATAQLQEADLALGSITEEYSEDQAVGTILAQGLEPGTEHRSGTEVPLVISQGPKPIDVPSVVGETEDDARTILGDAGLDPAPAPDRVFHPSILAGSVVSQSPAQGQLFRGDPVILVISKGPELIDVPDLVGMQVEEATAELKRLGFEVKINNVLGGFFGTVRVQDPVDTAVPKGSVVTLTVV